MNWKQYAICSYMILMGISVNAQSTFVPSHSEEAYWYRKIESKQGALHTTESGSNMPINRKTLAPFFHKTYTSKDNFNQLPSFNRVTDYQIQRAIGINGEWIEDASGIDAATRTRRPLFKYFYTTKENLFHHHNEDFFVVVNPILYTQLGADERSQTRYINYRGAEVRGRIWNKIGFYTQLGDRQERPMEQVLAWEQQFLSFPGNDYYRVNDQQNFDAFVGRGYFTVDLIPSITQLSFGYDKQFIGNGIRSLIQSDEGAASTFLRLTTHWKGFQLDNLYQELVGDFPGLGNDERLPKKYNSFHQLSTNIGRKLNIAFFENTTYGQQRLQVHQLVPLPFFNTVMRSLEARQKTSLGMQFKYLPIKGLQVYGQMMLDELQFGNANRSIDKSKYAAQLGAQAFDVFGLANVDVQLEVNHVAPYMYQSGDGKTNHTHFNQPLAHAMGAGFTELIAKLRYQPIPRLYIDGTASWYTRKEGQNFYNNGNDLRMQYKHWAPDYTINYQNDLQGIYLNGNIAYELFVNFFLELGATYINNQSSTNAVLQNAMGYGGLRWNISRKQYMIYNL